MPWFDDSKESYQNSALLGFARASEKTGKMAQAEDYYLKALKRYPQSSKTATSVACFYLRQNIQKAAAMFCWRIRDIIIFLISIRI